MWLRNIIWFILLTGIIIFSILLFILITNPPVSPPNYTPSTTTTNTPEKQTSAPKEQTVINQPVKSTGGWVSFGYYVGYLPLFLWIVPIIPLFQSRRSFPFFIKGVLLFLAMVSIHGGILLRQAPANKSIITGILLYFFFFLFYLRVLSFFSTSRKIHWKKLWIPIGIIVFFIFLHLLW